MTCSPTLAKTHRRNFHLLFLLGFLATFAVDSTAQSLPAGRVIPWAPGVQGGIPIRTTIFTNFFPDATADQIQAAIVACPSNRVIYFNPGTYVLTNLLLFYGNRSGITLRGAGPDRTILAFSNVTGYAHIYFRGSPVFDPPPSQVNDCIGGYTAGSTSLTLGQPLPDNSIVRNGDVVVLDQLNDPNLVNPNGYSDSYNMGREGGARAQLQLTRITSIDTSRTHIGISPAIYMSNWQSSLKPQIYYWGYPAYSTASRCGIEDLKILNLTPNNCPQYNVAIESAESCWVKNVESESAWNAHVFLFRTLQCEIRDSYFHKTRNYASQSYGVDIRTSSAALIENNITYEITAPVLISSGVSGCVIGYNYCSYLRYDQSPGWLATGITTHGAHPTMNLYEGNVIPSVSFDFIHGSASHTTVFRNALAGWETNKNNNTFPIEVMCTNRYVNVVGNVLGTAGYHDRYQYGAGDLGSSAPPTVIYKLGRYGTSAAVPGWSSNSDFQVENTIIRDGNYDSVSGHVQWNDSASTSHILAPSMYLSKQPVWWNTATPWPPIGPDVVGLYKPIPAQLRFAGLNTGVVLSPPAVAPSPVHGLRIVQ
jgi:hypothetical protein